MPLRLLLHGWLPAPLFRFRLDEAARDMPPVERLLCSQPNYIVDEDLDQDLSTRFHKDINRESKIDAGVVLLQLKLRNLSWEKNPDGVEGEIAWGRLLAIQPFHLVHVVHSNLP
jgi:hypothetical protein